ncbi:hypothetical protein [Ruania halotolerans]|uniref:hypothetical protein n=1 Tax=Ruania halotolerans TaxID=2897773 RepID=UPI001E5D7DEA|nr:hypothetical protein [Ruania halotolerans]UFU06028.1 hypothetical protein LQF10_16620 [Ruania halotolerans]
MNSIRTRLARAGVAILATAGLVATASAGVAASTVPVGHYAGTSDAYTGATVDFDVDGNGNMSGFASESYIQCGLFPTPMTWAGMPSSAVTAGVPFAFEWDLGEGGERVHYELSGVVNADGSASGQGVASMPEISCSGYTFNWTAQADAPVYDPEVVVSPDSVMESDLADSGVSVSGSGFAPGSSVEFSVGGDVVESAAADGSGDVVFAYSAVLAPGEYAVVLSAAEGSASATLTVTEDPVVYEPEVVVSPAELTESAVAGSGVTVEGSGFAPGSSVEFSVGGDVVESAAADGSGDVVFAYSAVLAPGEYAVVLSAAEGSASATLTVTEDPVVYEPEVVVSPAELTESAVAGSGVTVEGSGFAPGSSVEFSVGGDVVESAAADGSGDVVFAYSAVLAPGEYAVVLTAAEGSASATLVVTEDPDPNAQIPAEPPTENELTSDAEDGISVPPTADQASTVSVSIGSDLAGERVGVWIFSDPVYLGTQTVGDDGTTTVTLPADMVGVHRIAAYAEDESLIGWDDIEILAAGGGDPDGDSDGSDADSDGGADGSDADSDGGADGSDADGGADGADSGSDSGAGSGSGSDGDSDDQDASASSDGADNGSDGEDREATLPEAGAAPVGAALAAIAALIFGAVLLLTRRLAA